MDLEYIKELLSLLKDTDVTDFQIERNGEKIRLRREKLMATVDITRMLAPHAQQHITLQHPAQGGPGPAQTQPPAIGAPLMDAETQRLVTVTSPLVGTFYRASSPDAKNYVEAGDRVKKGQTLCIVEAMKLMNEIESETDGVIVRILVENGNPVEYGEPLFLIDPGQ